MDAHRKKLVIAAAAVALVLGGAGAAYAGNADDDGEGTVSGPGADHARAAALVLTHGGKANSVELDDENGATWEVEVTKPNGKTVDVRLDEKFELVVIEGDSEDADGG